MVASSLVIMMSVTLVADIRGDRAIQNKTRVAVCGKVLEERKDLDGDKIKIDVKPAAGIGRLNPKQTVYYVEQEKGSPIAVIYTGGDFELRNKPQASDHVAICAVGILATSTDPKLAFKNAKGETAAKTLVLVAREIQNVVENEDPGQDLPARGKSLVTGEPICGKCGLGKFDVCTLGVANGGSPIVLCGDLANDHAESYKKVRVSGPLTLDETGLVRVVADKVEEAEQK